MRLRPNDGVSRKFSESRRGASVIEALGDNAPKNVLEAAKAAVYDAEKAIFKQANANKVATVSNVVEAVNNPVDTTVGKREQEKSLIRAVINWLTWRYGEYNCRR